MAKVTVERYSPTIKLEMASGTRLRLTETEAEELCTALNAYFAGDDASVTEE